MIDPASISFVDGIGVKSRSDDQFAGTYPAWWDGDRVFGGLVIAQATSAAMATVERPEDIHSLHGYFLRPAKPGDDTAISVDRVRDGRSFTTRRTSTIVEGKETFVMMASFHAPEGGEEYQIPMAQVAVPSQLGDQIEDDGAFDVIELGPSVQRADGTYESTRRAWIRCSSDLGSDPARHLAAAAYASDMTRAAFRPTSLGSWGCHVDASLDHSVWFHKVPDMGAWHLFDLHTVMTGRGRSYMRGSLSDESGAVALSMAQEILIRPIEGAVPVSFDDTEHPPTSP